MFKLKFYGSVKLKVGLYRRIKNSKVFTKSDLIVYSLVFVVLAFLFLTFTIFNTPTASNGFVVTLNDKTVLTYSNEQKSITVLDDYKDFVLVEQYANLYNITIYTDKDKLHFNKLTIDVVDNVASVTEANCSTSKECVHMPKISNQGFIYCAIHGLKIIPTGSSGLVPPIVG